MCNKGGLEDVHRGGQSLKRLIVDQVCAAAKVSNLGGASQ